MPDLERDISRRLAADARSPAYLRLAQSQGAETTVAEFVRKWLVQPHGWTAPEGLKIEVHIGD